MGQKADLREQLAAGLILNEARVNRDTRLLENVTLLGRISGNGRRYSERAMRDAARLYEGTKLFLDHPTRRELEERDGNRSVRDLCGKVLSARVVGDHVRGNVQLLSGPDGDRVLSLAEEMPDAVGHSHRAVGQIGRDNDGTMVVESLDRVFAVELVTEPATTAGLFESLVDGADQGAETMQDLTLEKLKAERADLVEQIAEEVRQSAEDESEIAQLKAELKALREENDTLKAKEAVRERQAAIDAKLAEADLPDLLVTDVFRESLAEAADEEKIDALIAERKALAKRVGKSGPVSTERDPDKNTDVNPAELAEQWRTRLFA